jgi:hypothetical protein
MNGSHLFYPSSSSLFVPTLSSRCTPNAQSRASQGTATAKRKKDFPFSIPIYSGSKNPFSTLASLLSFHNCFHFCFNKTHPIDLTIALIITITRSLLFLSPITIRATEQALHINNNQNNCLSLLTSFHCLTSALFNHSLIIICCTHHFTSTRESDTSLSSP